MLFKNAKQNTKNSLAETYFLQAEELRLENKNKEAIDKYLHSILINKDNPTSYLGLGIAYKSIKNYDKAIINLKKAEKLMPSDFTVQKELALCNIINGDFENGMKYLINSIKIEPDNIDMQMQLALAHEMIEEEDMALMIYQKIIDTKPDYTRAYIQKATLYMYLEDYLNCAKVFNTVIKLKPDYYRAFLALGICYDKLGNTSAAKRYYKKYLKLSSNIENNREISKRIYKINANKSTENKLRIV